MTEAAAATPEAVLTAYRSATLAARHAALWIAAARSHEQDQRHAQAMAVLKALIERTGAGK